MSISLIPSGGLTVAMLIAYAEKEEAKFVPDIGEQLRKNFPDPDQRITFTEGLGAIDRIVSGGKPPVFPTFGEMIGVPSSLEGEIDFKLP